MCDVRAFPGVRGLVAGCGVVRPSRAGFGSALLLPQICCLDFGTAQ